MEIRIRSFAPDDHETVRELFAAGLLGYCPPGENQSLRGFIEYSLKTDMADIQGTYFDSGGHFWVATTISERGEELIVGSVGLEGKPDKRGELRRLTVREGYRRNGLARRLIEHVEGWAKEREFQSIVLNSDTDMKNAHKLYYSLGYTEYHRELLVEDPRKELLFLEKSLVVVKA